MAAESVSARPRPITKTVFLCRHSNKTPVWKLRDWSVLPVCLENSPPPICFDVKSTRSRAMHPATHLTCYISLVIHRFRSSHYIDSQSQCKPLMLRHLRSNTLVRNDSSMTKTVFIWRPASGNPRRIRCLIRRRFRSVPGQNGRIRHTKVQSSSRRNWACTRTEIQSRPHAPLIISRGNPVSV